MPGDTQDKVTWVEADSETLVRVLLEEKAAGKQSGAGFKQATWVRVADVLAKEGSGSGGKKTAEKCRDHFKIMKKNWKSCNKAKSYAGFGWDPVRKVPLGSSDADWDALCASDSSLRRWRTTPYPLFDEVAELCSASTATGSHAFVPGASAINVTVDNLVVDSRASDEESGSDSSQDELRQFYHPEASSQAPLPTPPVEHTAPPSTPLSASSGVKRTRSPSASASSKKPRSHAGKGSAASAAQHLSDAVLSVVDAFKTSETVATATLQSSPQRHRFLAREAIAKLEEDDDLSDDEFTKAVKVVSKSPDVANSFLSIKKKERRTLFIRNEVQLEYL